MSSSSITKNALATSLKRVSSQKPFDKVSISDITNDCGLNRQSFYYHFQDKYELLSWIYYNELFVYITHGIRFENWFERLEGLLTSMEVDKKFYSSALKSSDNTFEEYLFDIMHKLFSFFFENMVDNSTQKKEDREFFANFYSHGFCGIIIDWAVNGMNETPHSVMQHMRALAFENVDIGEGFRATL